MMHPGVSLGRLRIALELLDRETRALENLIAARRDPPSQPFLDEASRWLVECAMQVLERARDVSGQEVLDVEDLLGELAPIINPPEARTNYTYTPPYSIEKVVRSYLDWRRSLGRTRRIKGE